MDGLQGVQLTAEKTRHVRLSLPTLRASVTTLIHEGASVKTGARRARDCPDIHPASSAAAERHERNAVAPIHASGVGLRHVGPRDAT